MKEKVKNCWEYYRIIDEDMKTAMRYIDSRNQADVFSFEFAKNIVLACTECESLFKIIGELKTNKTPGNIGEYKDIILNNFPAITSVEVYANGKRIVPFQGWDDGNLKWWDSYNNIKHNRGDYYETATFSNAANAVGALYLLNLYISMITGVSIYSDESEFISSDYGKCKLLCDSIKSLPGF